MSIRFQNVLFSVLFSLMIVFMPISVSVFSVSLPCISSENHVVSSSLYSVCSASSKQNKSVKKNKNKQEASFLSKAVGFIIGLIICAVLMGISGLISFTIFRSNFDLNTGNGPWVFHGLLTGLCYFVGRSIVLGIITSIFAYTANAAGFVQWFDYACYGILLYIFFKDKYRFSFCVSIMGGYFLGNFLIDKLFG